jgi:PhnB protein
MAVKTKPDEYHSITPYLIVKGAAAAIEYYQKVFGAKELLRLSGPDGQVGHAELSVGDSVLMLADENPAMGALSPQTLGGSAVRLMLYVDNVDDVVQQAVAAGAKIVRPVENQFYGDRAGGIEDPYGHYWHVATHLEDVTPEETKRRADELFSKKSDG